mmetsp:Transcript_23383/g.54370  ORF Transcript_23383/g.54370 Transcript_23383/m.54370 type:complete len:853 (+) Transcript_23383:70-2628(+)
MPSPTALSWMRRLLAIQGIVVPLLHAEVVFHDDFSQPPAESAKWTADASRFGQDGGWTASQTSSAMLLTGNVWAGYRGNSFRPSDYGGRLSVEATWSPGISSYMDEDFWIAFCGTEAPSSSTPSRTHRPLNLPYANCVVGQMYDTAATDEVSSYVHVPDVGTERGTTKCHFRDAAFAQSAATRKGLATIKLTLDSTTKEATFESNFGCDSLTISTTQGDSSIADQELWVYVGVDNDFLAWVELESVTVRNSQGLEVWSTSFQDRQLVLNDWFSHVMYSKGCPSVMQKGSIVAIPDGFLEVSGQSTCMQADVTIAGDGGASGTSITVEMMPDYLAPVLVDNDIAILVCASASQYTWTKDTQGDCLKFMMLQSSDRFEKQLAVPGSSPVLIGEDGDFACGSDHFIRLRATIEADKIIFEDSAGCNKIEHDNPFTSADTLYVYLGWDEQSQYHTTVLDFKVETGTPETDLALKSDWEFTTVECPSELHLFIWLDTSACVPASKFIGQIGPGIADGNCHWGEKITASGPFNGLNVYYKGECATDGSGLQYTYLYFGNRCTSTPSISLGPSGLGSCLADSLFNVDFSSKLIGECPATPGSGTASVTSTGSISFTINTVQFLTSGEGFTASEDVLSALRIALATRTSTRPEYVEVAFTTSRRLAFLETDSRGRRLQTESVNLIYTITSYGDTAGQDAAAVQEALTNSDELLMDMNEALQGYTLGEQIVTSIDAVDPLTTTQETTSTAATTVAVAGGSSGDDDGGSDTGLLVGIGVAGGILALVCVGAVGWVVGRRRDPRKQFQNPNPALEGASGDGVVVVGRPVEDNSNNKENTVDGTARNQKGGTASSSGDDNNNKV